MFFQPSLSDFHLFKLDFISWVCNDKNVENDDEARFLRTLQVEVMGTADAKEWTQSSMSKSI